MNYLFLCTPYSLYPLGLDRAFDLAVRTRGLLVQAGIKVFSPIIHSHVVATACGIDPLSHEIWLEAEAPFRHFASGAIMLMAESWEISHGMSFEKDEFEKAGKPIFWMTPGEIPEIPKELFSGSAT